MIMDKGKLKRGCGKMPLHFSTSSFCCKILFHLAQIVDDKLAGTAPAAAGML